MQMIFTVDKICGYIKNILDSETLLQDIEIKGEVSNYSESNSNAYFVLKGKDSQISCVFFATDLRKFLPKNGDNCIVKGTVNFYKKGGKINFYVKDIRPSGQGDSYLKFLQLKDKLQKQGLFLDSHKTTLPDFVNKIGVITSRSGAVIHDIIETATKKYPSINIALYSVKVQGESSAKEIAEGIKVMENTNADVIIVARGGGSNEDLSAYNTEIVAKAVYNCKKPIVSAVGHETDYTLCDLTADVRVATPTAAAEITVQNALILKDKIKNTINNINNLVISKFNNSHYQLKNTLNNMFSNINVLLENYSMDLKYKLNNINYKTEKIFNNKFNNVNNTISKIDALSPLKVLQRGFSVITDNKNNALKNVKNLSIGQNVNIIMQDGKAEAEIKNIKERLL